MDTTERQVIDELFGKVRQAEAQGEPRDPEAEAYIQRKVDGQPAAPYYMSQAIVIQEQALAAAQARIEELERQAAERPAGGFLGSLFGGGPSRPAARPSRHSGVDPRVAAYTQGHHRGGFLGGAMQTALGVAGGVLLGSAIAGMLAPDMAAADEPAPEDADADMDMGGMDEEF